MKSKNNNKLAPFKKPSFTPIESIDFDSYIDVFPGKEWIVGWDDKHIEFKLKSTQVKTKVIKFDEVPMPSITGKKDSDSIPVWDKTLSDFPNLCLHLIDAIHYSKSTAEAYRTIINYFRYLVTNGIYHLKYLTPNVLS